MDISSVLASSEILARAFFLSSESKRSSCEWIIVKTSIVILTVILIILFIFALQIDNTTRNNDKKAGNADLSVTDDCLVRP
ncbi:hypothetical protein ELR70_01570 [Pseudoalteromonas sp. R3]|nr:hypothetical protein ELR70_01570 [Pseudoalteromonas sp. R3]